MRFKDISSRFQVFYKKAILINFTKFTEKQSYWSLFSDKVSGLKFKKRLADCRWATISGKYSLFVTSTSVTKCYPWPWLFSDDKLETFSEQILWIAASSNQ